MQSAPVERLDTPAVCTGPHVARGAVVRGSIAVFVEAIADEFLAGARHALAAAAAVLPGTACARDVRHTAERGHLRRYEHPARRREGQPRDEAEAGERHPRGHGEAFAARVATGTGSRPK